jgi:hypothetical protein
LSEDANANWVLYDKHGSAVSTSAWTTVPSDRMVRLLQRHRLRSWPMPTTLPMGLILAMVGHGLWNGTSWGLGVLLAENESWMAVLVQLGWLACMIGLLWLCILRCLPTIVLGPKQRSMP